MYIKLGNKPRGGNDKNNDCLYNCLKYFVFDIEDYFKSPAELKKYLGLKRNDKVPLSCLDKIETKLKNFQINVRGEFTRSSTIKSNKEINLILNNEHYEIEIPNKPSLTPNYKYTEKQPLLYDKFTFEGFDGVKKWVLSKKEKNEILYNPKSPYILVNREEQKDENNKKITITIEEEYEIFIKTADKLKVSSKGLINLYKSGGYKYSALDLFDRTTKFVNVEPIFQDEAYWIKNSSFSSIIWAEQYEGELYKYDVKSLFPYLMTLTTNRFPIKRGEFKIINELPEILEFGIYRCEIEESEDYNINKLFRYNKKNFYTQLDIYHARKLKLQINLIQDNKPNLLYYTPDKLIKFGEVFKPFVDILYELKEKGIEKSKKILNMLWGALCEVDKRKHFVIDKYEIPDDEEISEIYPCKYNENETIIKTTKINNYYKTPYARLCPFLLSKSRTYMSEIMYPIKENIHRINVDGFYTDKLLHSNKNVKIGELKYEGYNQNGIILNKTNNVGEFI